MRSGRRGSGFVGAEDASRQDYARRLAAELVGNTRLDRLVELAARLLGTESAQVSIISDVQTVVGGVGVAASEVGRQSPAAESLCTVTMTKAGPLEIEDAANDVRVAALPPVASGAVGSYLGMPLAPGGFLVGALCVYDANPRAWSAQEVSLLELLADAVIAELQVAALEASYAEDRRVWQVAVDAAGVGAFDWNLRTGELRWDDRLLELFGVTRDSFGHTIDAFNALVHPEDRDRVAEAVAEAIDSCGLYTAEYRIVRPNGELRWISAQGQAHADEESQVATRMVGAAYDTTRAQEGEQRVARILEAMPAGFYHLDRDWRFTFANSEAKRVLAPIGQGLIGQVVWELFPATVGSDFERSYRQAMETGEPVHFEAHYPPPLDGWYEIRAWPTPDGLSVYFLDVTERHATQEALARSARRAIIRTETSAALTEPVDAEEGVGRLAQVLTPALADWCIVTVAEGSEPFTASDWRRRLRDLGWWHADPEQRDLLTRYARVRVPALREESYQAEVLRSRRLLVANRAYETVAAGLEPGPARDYYQELAPETAVFVPMLARGRTVGLLTLARAGERGPFLDDELETLRDVAARAGLALDNSRLYREHRDLAEGLQRSLLTDPPPERELQVTVRYEPAAELAQVGGDWYDFFHLPDGSTTIVIGDVVGHDTAAAAAMGQLRGLLRGIAVTTNAGPAEVLRRLDEALPVLEIATTATSVVARLSHTPEDLAAGVTRLRWANAGHPPPLVVLPDTGRGIRVEVLESHSPDLLLGLDPATSRTEHEAVLPRGSKVLLYTDGLVERRGQSIDEGIEALRHHLSALAGRGLDLEVMCEELLTRLVPARREDDVALLLVRLEPPA